MSAVHGNTLMPTESRPLARSLLRVVLGTPDVPDRDLLARFVSSRDEEAFAEIVRRHGPMVLAACRRVTGRPHDADDAFQAAFLVLARRAAHINRPELLANWLYGVACRTALEARAARRRVEEHVVPAAPEPAAPTPPDDTAELRRVIDEELAKLPDKYRTAVVLCDLEGLPRAAAAAQLGIPEGTLSSRLAHARKVLAERLTRRGVTTGSAAVAAALVRDAMAVAVPHNLTFTTVHAAVRFAPGIPSPPGVSPSVSSLTDGVLKTMLATRLRQLFAVGLLTCGLIGVGAALAQQLGAPAPAPLPDEPVAGLNPLGLPGQDAQPKKAEPKKVAAKGIEDDDVPYGTFPAQAAVRIEEGKLIVRQRGHYYEPVTRYVTEQTVQGAVQRAVTSYERKSGVTATTHDPADVSVFDMKGNRLAAKDWKAQLKGDVHALVATDGKLPNPRELTLFKADTLLVVLPAPVAPAYAPAAYPATTATGQSIYVPPSALPARPAGSAIPPASTAPALPFPSAPATPNLPSQPRSAPVPPPAPRVTPPAPGTVAPALPPPRVPEDVLPPLDAPSTINSTVLSIDGDLVEIGIGRDAGLEVGTKLGVIRDRGRGPGKFLGELTIKTVRTKDAVGQFTAFRAGIALDKLDADELPRKGDTVYFAPNPVP
jgi:RNA polymerase sigma factor (sigma-70 family)